jgi:hypothetical protein
MTHRQALKAAQRALNLEINVCLLQFRLPVVPMQIELKS